MTEMIVILACLILMPIPRDWRTPILLIVILLALVVMIWRDR